MKELFIFISKIVEKFRLKTIVLPNNFKEIKINVKEIDRAGLNLAGFDKFFDVRRIQIFGDLEIEFLRELSEQTRLKLMYKFCKKGIPAIIVTNKNKIFKEMVKACRMFSVPLLKTNEETSIFMASLVYFLNDCLGLFVGIHGVLVEVFGKGVLILGESGVGKSRTALELIKRGHFFIADDMVKVKKDINKNIVGTFYKNIKNLMEVKGVSIVNLKDLFGDRVLKEKTKIDFVVELQKNTKDKIFGFYESKKGSIKILDVRLKKYEFMVEEKDDIASLIEILALKNKQNENDF